MCPPGVEADAAGRLANLVNSNTGRRTLAPLQQHRQRPEIGKPMCTVTQVKREFLLSVGGFVWALKLCLHSLIIDKSVTTYYFQLETGTHIE